MTTTHQRLPSAQAPPPRAARPSRTPPRRRRWQNVFRTSFARGDLGSLLMTWALMAVTALALEAGEWTDNLGTLVPVSLFAVGFGFLLARSHYSELLALVLSSVYSLVIVVGINAHALVESGSVRSRVYELADMIGAWISGALAGEQPPHDNVAFVLFLSVLFWFLGHNAAWHIFRVDRVWRVLVPTGLVLLTNQFYYQGDNALDGYLVAFVVLAFLLLIRSHIEAREFHWYLHRVSFPRYVRRTFFIAGGLLAVIIVALSWAAPAGSDEKSLDRVEELLSYETLARLNELMNRLFSSLEGEGIATADYYGGDELQLSGAVQLGDGLVMSVEAPFGPRYYWRSTVYDTYDFNRGTWKHYRTIRAYVDQGVMRLNPGPTLPGTRQDVQQTINLLMRTSRLIYAAAQPVLLGLPVEAELDCVNDLGRTCVNDNQPSDVAIVRARSTLRQGDSYDVTSSVSVASATELRAAGTEYPEWVLRRYLQGMNDVTPRVRDQAAIIVNQAGAQTPYDRAKAIETWLRANIRYNESIPAPPSDQDPVEWFLFDQREGYCNYYATAMVLMLRSQGIPARMAAGFAQGTWDAAQGTYLVRERDAHTWVEAYFPGYGWVEFEPTADEAPIDRPGEQQPPPAFQQPTPTPWPSPTPLPTATLTPSPPPTDPSGLEPTPDMTATAEAPFVPSTPTGQPSPTPSATPPPPPDVRVNTTNGGTGVLEIILWTLGIFLLVVVAIVLLIAFAIWYVEYRGLRGLNVVQKAYARLAIYGRWLGLSFHDSATPDERRYQLVAEVPDGEQPISGITSAYIHDRYAPELPAEYAVEQQEYARSAWQEARLAFIRRKLARWFRRPGWDR